MEKKKLMSLFALGCGALLLTGCGTDSKKDDDEKEKESTTQAISCVVEQEEEGMVTTAETEFVYDKEQKKLVSGTMSMKMDYTEALKELTDEEKEQTESLMESMLGGMCETFEEEGYANCKSNFKSGKFDMTMDFDMDKLEETTDGDVNVDMTLDELKEYFEDTEGTKCTIK